MPLSEGTRLDHYEIVGPLGAGGMGEVYRAVDGKLRREVAVKILPPAAHLLASLNHPNIAAIYGLEHSDGIRFLVLELVEGQTLAESSPGDRPLSISSMKILLKLGTSRPGRTSSKLASRTSGSARPAGSPPGPAAPRSRWSDDRPAGNPGLARR